MEEACSREAIGGRVMPTTHDLGVLASEREGKSVLLPINSAAPHRSLALPRPTMHPLMDITAKEPPMLSDF